MKSALRCLALVAGLGAARAHGSMIMPPARNSIDSVLKPWNGGKHPPTGVIDPKGAFCTNGTEECRSGQSTFWFSQGCTIGCSKCDGHGSRIPNFDHCPHESINATLLPKYWTANIHAVPGSYEDIFKYNPWRAPGLAPTFDACGMAGGSPFPTSQAAEYNTTKFAKQGDLGSQVLKPFKSGTVWKRGSVARVRQQLTAAHGGGYIFRLCPASEKLTEACFNKIKLQFASDPTTGRPMHTLRFADPKLDRKVNATVVAEGGGVGWMVHPWGLGPSGSSDYVVGPGRHCYYPNGTRDNGTGPPIEFHGWHCDGCSAPLYAADGACPCLVECTVRWLQCRVDVEDTCIPLPWTNIKSNRKTDSKEECPGFPGISMAAAGSDPSRTPDPAPGVKPDKYAVENELHVPEAIPAGDYVLSYRWDCEGTSQIWQSCSDITIE